MKPSSFCCITTINCINETFSWLLSLSLHHPGERVYIMSDNITKQKIEKEYTPSLNLDIIWFLELDTYSKKTRQHMVNQGEWVEFQMKKALIIQEALKNEDDVLFMDTDIIITSPIRDIDNTKDIGVSPAFIRESDMKKVGYYNGGMLWVKNKEVPHQWIEYSKKSRYFDQAAIDDLVLKYSYFCFGEHHNIQSWRFLLSDESPQELKQKFSFKDGKIYFKQKEITSIHTHFLQTGLHKDFNAFIINLLVQAQKYKELLCIFRIINHGKWIINLPKQPRPGSIFNHKNDSFRELLKLYKDDVEIRETQNCTHIWICPTILLYDRPTLEWKNNEVQQAHLVLLGNGDIKKEGLSFENCLPWIFWPRNPEIYEKFQYIHPPTNREIETIFIGNYENPVQEQYRVLSSSAHTTKEWKDVIQEFHITKGTEHKFTPIEYLTKLSQSKYGLCLRGYGSKCHREVECMGLGTVPIITKEVCISSYINPPIENKHYIYVENPSELESKLKQISHSEWQTMSLNCIEWYMKNVHSSSSWKLTIENIMYR
jgi:hypothetical protein